MTNDNDSSNRVSIGWPRPQWRARIPIAVGLNDGLDIGLGYVPSFFFVLKRPTVVVQDAKW